MPFIIRKTITETFLERVSATPAVCGFQFKPTHTEMGLVDQWKEVSFREFYNKCRLISFGLMKLGIKPGDKVVILSNTRFEWSLCDMAILGAAGVTVPIYASNTPDDVIYIAENSDARILIIENSIQLQKIIEKKLENANCLPLVEKIIVIEPTAMMLAARYPELSKNILTLQALHELGRREEARDPNLFDRHLSDAKPHDLVTICYTSGTTGTPKGVMITHDNLMSVLEDCVAALGKQVSSEKEVILSFLPFSHILGKVESLAGYTFGWKQVFAENYGKLMENIEEVKPTVIFAVPRIFERAFEQIVNSIDEGSPVKKKLFHWALEAGSAYYNAIWTRKSPSVLERLEYQAAKVSIFNTLLQRFGGRLRFAICGGAPLSKKVGEFFQIIGIQILEGYGLTETSAPVTLNTPDNILFGSVGRPLPEVTLKIAQDSEILVKSRKVFKAYYKMDEESQNVLESGWFHTGDIGFLDSDGFLFITDRKKDLIVMSNGKNVPPQKIEAIARNQKLINQFVLHGDNRHYLTALLTLDRNQIIQYANDQQILFSEYAELIKNPKILSMTQKIIDEMNKELPSFESIKKFIILPNDFSVESGELTPSFKIRRDIITQRYKTELDSMYGDSARVPLDSAQQVR